MKRRSKKGTARNFLSGRPCDIIIGTNHLENTSVISFRNTSLLHWCAWVFIGLRSIDFGWHRRNTQVEFEDKSFAILDLGVRLQRSRRKYLRKILKQREKGQCKFFRIRMEMCLKWPLVYICYSEVIYLLSFVTFNL